MSFKISKPFLQAAGLGAIAGMRTFYAPAVASHLYRRHPSKYLRNSPLAFMQSTTASKVFKVLAGGELVGDKLPTAPNRIAAPGLTGRIISGILVGSVTYEAHGKQPLIGGLIGGVAAAASTFGCFFLRKFVVKNTRIPDPYIGAVEDALVIGAGVLIVNNVS